MIGSLAARGFFDLIPRTGAAVLPGLVCGWALTAFVAAAMVTATEALFPSLKLRRRKPVQRTAR